MSISPTNSQSISPLHSPQVGMATDPIAIANSVSPILEEAVAAGELDKAVIPHSKTVGQNEDLRIGIRFLSATSGVALGVLITLGLTGVLLFSNPIGWGIAGGILLITLVGAAYYGGLKEFIENIGIAALGALIPMPIGSLAAVAMSGPASIGTAFASAVIVMVGGTLLKAAIEEPEPEFKNIQVPFFKSLIPDPKQNQALEEALEEKDWTKATRAIENGAYVGSVAKASLSLVKKGKLDAATFMLSLGRDSHGLQYANDCFRLVADDVNLINDPITASSFAKYQYATSKIRNENFDESFPRRNLCKNALSVFARAFPARSKEVNRYILDMDRAIFQQALRHKDYVHADAFLKLVTKEMNIKNNITDWLGSVEQTYHASYRKSSIESEAMFNGLKIFIDNGLTADMINETGLLYHFVTEDCLDGVELLLKMGALPKAEIQGAMTSKNIKMIELLLKYGADPYQNISAGWERTTPFKFALQSQNPALIQAFSGYVKPEGQKIIDAYKES